jgi:hypothetical protein
MSWERWDRGLEVMFDFSWRFILPLIFVACALSLVGIVGLILAALLGYVEVP